MRGLSRLLALGAIFLPMSAGAAETSACYPAGLAIHLEVPLPRTAAKLTDRLPVTIVAIGSSSTAGAGASTPAKSYPSRLAVELTGRFPGTVITVINRGVNGEVENQMEARFGHDVLPERPDLVIWQVGTNSVLRDNDIRLYRLALERGIEKLKLSGADVLIMDLQYAPKVLSHPLYQDMLRKITMAARNENVPVFHRFAIMRQWITSGQFDFNAILSPDQLHMNDLSYGCVAALLADAITDTVRNPLIARGEPVPAPAARRDVVLKQHEFDTLPAKATIGTATAKK